MFLECFLVKRGKYLSIRLMSMVSTMYCRPTADRVATMQTEGRTLAQDMHPSTPIQPAAMYIERL